MVLKQNQDLISVSPNPTKGPDPESQDPSAGPRGKGGAGTSVLERDGGSEEPQTVGSRLC
jgi:hypothetical protein